MQGEVIKSRKLLPMALTKSGFAVIVATDLVGIGVMQQLKTVEYNGAIAFKFDSTGAEL